MMEIEMLAKAMTVKQRLWLDHVKAADKSNGSIADYAQVHGLRLKTLYQWKSKLVKLALYRPVTKSTQSDFIELTPAQFSSCSPSCTIILANGTKIEFAGKLDSKLIRTIITSSGIKF